MFINQRKIGQKVLTAGVEVRKHRLLTKDYVTLQQYCLKVYHGRGSGFGSDSQEKAGNGSDRQEKKNPAFEKKLPHKIHPYFLFDPYEVILVKFESGFNQKPWF